MNMANAVRRTMAALMVLGSTGALAVTTNLLDLSQWRVYGTAGLSSGTLTIGDSIGYDRTDADRDGNPYNVWYGTTPTADQGVDYDEAVTVGEFAAPLTLSWTGCFPATAYGYNNIFLGRKNKAFTGAAGSKQYLITQEFGLSARWDYPGLNTVVLNAGNFDVQRITAASKTGSGYCGNYRIEWASDLLKFYYNNTKVREQRYAYAGPVSVVVRSFELPHTLTAMTMESAIGKTQAAGTRGLGSVAGAKISGTVVDAAGKTTTLDTSNAAIAGDLSFAFNETGELIAHVSGTGAAQGVAFRYEVDYDTVTQNLTGTVADNANKVPRAITFTNKGGLNWQARVSASAGHSSSGAAVSYDMTFDIVLPAEAIYASEQFPAGGRLKVDLARTEPISIPINVSQLGVSRTESTSVVTDGSFVASLVPGANASFNLTGNIEGAFRLDPMIQFSVAYTPLPGISVTVPITIDPTGRFSGALSGNTAQNNLRFVGEWSAVASDGVTAGGTLEMAIPLDAKTGMPPASATLAIVGTATTPVTVSGVPAAFQSMVPSSVSVPISIQVPVPLSFQ